MMQLTLFCSAENKKTPAIAKSFFANSPLQENNHSRGKEVKSRFFGSRNSSTKLATTLPITEKSFLLENEKKDSKQMVNCVHLDTEVENIVPGKETHVESKENTFGNEVRYYFTYCLFCFCWNFFTSCENLLFS